MAYILTESMKRGHLIIKLLLIEFRITSKPSIQLFSNNIYTCVAEAVATDVEICSASCFCRAISLQEAAVWKTIQRLIGTIIGATAGYLIMLREPVVSRGSSVLVLVCFCTFVMAHGVHTAFRYAIFLALLTMTSLTVSQYAEVRK